MISKKMLNFKTTMLCLAALAGGSLCAEARITMQIDTITGGVSQWMVEVDTTRMHWLTATDHSQYKWIGPDFAWGLGYSTIKQNHRSEKMAWNKPESISNGGRNVTYRLGDISLNVERTEADGAIVERYTFTNTGKSILSMSETGIYTPFNDNYPDAIQCVNGRANTHIWNGGNAAYVNALRMGGYAPHVGVAVTEGEIVHYEVWERGLKKQNSQTRGIFALNIPDLTLRPGQSYTLAWRIFDHTGNVDFREKLLKAGSVIVECDKYVFTKGETACVTLTASHELDGCTAKLNGVPVEVRREDGKYLVEMPLCQEGEARFDFYYDGGKTTHALCLVVPPHDQLIASRVNFIRTHQQMNNPDDPRCGAFMVYDNEGDSIYLNDTPNCNPVDRDEGAERTGMGLLLARQYLLTHDAAIRESLERYLWFVRNRLQTPDYTTYSSVDHKGRNRGYNYMWAATLFFYGYLITGDKQYALDGFQTIQSLYKQFGHGFYSIEIPVILGLNTLQKAGLEQEYATLLEDFRASGDIFVKNGIRYPKFEVNYEQSIVAPAVYFLEQLYIVTGDKKYLDEVERQMPVLEAFNGFQPSFHLNDIAIRHWDGYWFGKREMFGDTFPHYWSTITAAAFHYYAIITGKKEYQLRAEKIVDNNLCLFSKDGRAACAYLYPRRVDGVKASFYDPYANDQDWALYYYLMVKETTNSINPFFTR